MPTHNPLNWLQPQKKICHAQRIAVLTGAGISAESGIPTFRDSLTGLWEKFDPQELATPEAYCRNPSLVWGWYEWRRMKVLQNSPNPGHLALAQLAAQVPQLTLITQNVDDLHERAGSPEVLHLHGAACTIPAALNATTPIPLPPACLKNQTAAAPFRPHAAVNAAAPSAPA